MKSLPAMTPDCAFQVYMACQSMLIVLVGFTPEYRIEQQHQQQDGVPVSQHVAFTENVDSIVTEVRVADSSRMLICLNLRAHR